MKTLNLWAFSLLGMLVVGCSFFIARYINIQVIPFLAFDDLTQLIYLPAGVRLIAVAAFGWFGAAGIVLGWILCHLLGDEKTLLECLFLGIISGITAIASLHIWQILFRVDDVLSQLNLKSLLTLVLVSSFISAIIRFLYIAKWDPTVQFLPIFSIGLIGDISGSLIILYSLKGGFLLRDLYLRRY